MSDWRQIIAERLAKANLDPTSEAEIVEELSQHLEDRYRELCSSGLAEAESRRRTLQELNNSQLGDIRRRTRATPELGTTGSRGGYMHGFIHDLRIACRNLRTKPAFSLMAIGMLALGVAGNAAIFSIFNGLFLRPLPFTEPDRLVDLDETAPKWNLQYVGVSDPDFYDWRKNNVTFDGMAFFSDNNFNLSDHGNVQRIQGAQVTAGMLDVLGLKPALGRNFRPEEDRPGGAKVVLLSFDLWQTMFQGNRNVLGRVLQLDQVAHTVIGVLPREAVFPDRAQVWVPLAADPNSGNGWYLNGVGRMKKGITLERAKDDLMRVHKAVISTRKVNEITSPVLSPLRDRYLGDFRTVSHVLLGAVGVVLLIACVNIAALMMVRGASRAREIAIRTAIGATRGRIIRQLLTENLVLAAVGGILGVLLGDLCLRGMIRLMPDTLPKWISFAMDGRFVLFCIAITTVAAQLFGLAPTFQASQVDARGSLQDAGIRTTLSRARRATLGGLVVCEIGLALMLSISAGLLVEAFQKVLHVDPGFRPENVIVFQVSLPDATYPKPQSQIVFFNTLLDRLRPLPGVSALGATSAPPMGGHWGNFFEAEGHPPAPNEPTPVVLQVVATPGYFNAIGMTLLDGRPFDEHAGEPDSVLELVVNETLAKHFWPDGKAVGKRIRHNGATKEKWSQVVGVFRDEKHYGLEQAMKPCVFFPFKAVARNSMAIVMRSSIEPGMMIAPAREVLRKMDADLPMFRVRTMTEQLDRSLWARRAYSWLFGAFAIVALVLAAAGIYGVVSYAVTQRTPEIGIRMALGARPEQVLREVLRSGMVLVGIGLAVGLAGALAVGQLLKTLLFGVSSHDPIIYAAVALGVILVGLIANVVPARRAASVNPMRALRFE